MHLAKNGQQSSGKQTSHIDIQYYFITNVIHHGAVQINTVLLAIWWPISSLNLSGVTFHKFCNQILNITANAEITPASLE